MMRWRIKSKIPRVKSHHFFKVFQYSPWLMALLGLSEAQEGKKHQTAQILQELGDILATWEQDPDAPRFAREHFEQLDLKLQDMILDVATIATMSVVDEAEQNFTISRRLSPLWPTWYELPSVDFQDPNLAQVFAWEHHKALSALARSILQDEDSPHYGSRVWLDNGTIMGFQEGQSVRTAVLDISFFPWLRALPHTPQLQDANFLGVRYLHLGRQQLPTEQLANGQLQKLLYLNLSANQLTALPDTIGQLNELQVLDLGGCSRLQQLPETFGHLTMMQYLNLSLSTAQLGRLQQLPESFGHLTALQELHLGGRSQLQRLPDSFGHLPTLQELDLRECSQLQKLPETFGQLTALQYLNLSGCSQLQRLPDSFGLLTTLQELDLSGCSQLQQLPESFGHLTALWKLSLSECSQLQKLPEKFGQLTALQELDLRRCSQLQQLPGSFAHLTALQKLDLCYCNQLQQLPKSFGRLKQLVYLNISGCTSLAQSLPEPYWTPHKQIQHVLRLQHRQIKLHICCAAM